MTDIAKRLRERAPRWIDDRHHDGKLDEQAADEIVRLRARIVAARGLLGDLDLHPDDEEAMRRVLEEKA